jgi:DNA-binding NarL/FixJ family response regulator
MKSEDDGRSRDGYMEETDGSRGLQRRVKVLLADDHTMFREGLAGMLASSYKDEVEVVGKTDTGEEAIALAHEKNPDVLIMQVDRTLEKAKDTLKQIREGREGGPSQSSSSSSAPPKVVILTMLEDPQLLRKMMELGASAYIHKSASVEELFSVVRSATLDAGGKHVIVALPQGALELSEDGSGEDRSGEDRSGEDRSGEDRSGEDGPGEDGSGSVLSRRELQILLLTARGMSNRKIGTQLDISETTVKRHLANVYPKMGVNSRGEAVRIALENEWFTIREIEAAIDEEEE